MPESNPLKVFNYTAIAELPDKRKVTRKTNRIYTHGIAVRFPGDDWECNDFCGSYYQAVTRKNIMMSNDEYAGDGIEFMIIPVTYKKG